MSVNNHMLSNGYKRIGDKNPAFDRKWMYIVMDNKISTIFVNNSDTNMYLDSGWKYGKHPKNMSNIKDSKWIHRNSGNSVETKLIKPNLLDVYISDGWVIGRK